MHAVVLNAEYCLGVQKWKGPSVTGEHAHGVTKILKRDTPSENTSPRDEAHPAAPGPSGPPQPTPSAPPMPAATAAELNLAMNRGQHAQTASSQGPAQGQSGPAIHNQAGPTAAPSPRPVAGQPQPAQQTPAGLAAAAAAQAALAAPPPAPKQVPKYNPPATVPVSSAQAAQQQPKQHQPPSQTQQAPAVRPNQPPPYLPQQAFPQGQPLQMAGMRPQGPPSDPRLRTQQMPGPSSSSGATPSQQITAQARASQSQQGPGQPAATGGSAPPPSSFLQFGSMQHIPSSGDNNPAATNPLAVGIPAAMVPGSGAANGAARQSGPAHPAQGKFHSLQLLLVVLDCSSRLPSWLAFVFI